RRIAGPKIVDGKLDAEGLERTESGNGLFHVHRHGALGQLELETCRIDARIGENALHDGRELAVEELRGGEIDRYAFNRPALFLPAYELSASLPQYPFTDGGDKAALFGECDERAGRHQAALGVHPAHERFGAHNAAAGRIHLGLEVQYELAP